MSPVLADRFLSSAPPGMFKLLSLYRTPRSQCSLGLVGFPRKESSPVLPERVEKSGNSGIRVLKGWRWGAGVSSFSRQTVSNPCFLGKHLTLGLSSDGFLSQSFCSLTFPERVIFIFGRKNEEAIAWLPRKAFWFFILPLTLTFRWTWTVSLNRLHKIVKNREAWSAAVHGVTSQR